MSEWYGKVLIVLIPCAIIIVSETRNIVRALRGRKMESEDISEGGTEGRL